MAKWRKELEQYRINNDLGEDCTIMDCIKQDSYFKDLKLNEYEEEIKKLKSENQSLKDQLNNAKNQSFNSFMKDNRFR